MINILMYISTFMIIISFVGYFIMIFIGRKIKVSNSNGFDITKEIISEYNSINIIESKGYFNIYNIKRRVIKLTSKSYYGNDLSSISLSLVEAGISVVDSYKNKTIEMFRKVFSNLKILYIFPLIGILINNATYNVNDVRVGIVFVVLFSFISYVLIDIKSYAISWINENLVKLKEVSKDNASKIINFINKLLLIDKLIFFGELIIIIRFVAILLEIG